MVQLAEKRVAVVGGVAGGASCAARARRLSERAQIVIFDRGSHVSFANCGLPYYVGDVIHSEEDLLVATPETFAERFNIDIRCRTEVTRIDRERQLVVARQLDSGGEYEYEYDALVLATGAAPVRPRVPGIDLPGIFALRTIPDSRRIRDWIEYRQAQKAVIVGGGFIGLEMAENLVKRGVGVEIVEQQTQVMPTLDPEMVAPIHCRLRDRGVGLCLGQMVTSFARSYSHSLEIHTDVGVVHHADMVILAVGVKPETKLARDAGLQLGARGGIRVDDRMVTSDRKIWAVGDVVEVRDVVTGEWTLAPLAGPANRQGRVAADNIFGSQTRYRGVQGTAICGLFGMTVATTGASEKTLNRCAIPYDKIYLHPGNHATYYPGSKPIDMKLLFAPDGRILGAQAVGWEGVDKRIDAISVALQKRMTVFDLEECELCYAPQFGAAKDPVNVAGMIGSNAVKGDARVAFWEDLEDTAATILDVRDRVEFSEDHIPGAHNIPLDELRGRLAELTRERPIWVYCQVGHRAYYATRLLQLNGFTVKNLTGGLQTYDQLRQVCVD